MVWAKSHQGKVYHSVQVYLPLNSLTLKIFIPVLSYKAVLVRRLSFLYAFQSKHSKQSNSYHVHEKLKLCLKMLVEVVYFFVEVNFYPWKDVT